MIAFEILSEIRDIETIAAGRGVYIRRYLERTYGKGRWRKMKGMATIADRSQMMDPYPTDLLDPQSVVRGPQAKRSCHEGIG